MGESGSREGHFVWYELGTTDTGAAAEYYRGVVGWSPEAVPEMDYAIFKIGDQMAAGLMTLPPHLAQAGVPPHWIGYVAVADVDAMVGKVEAAGGSRKHGPADIPGVGRFAVVGDPAGAVFCLFKGQGDPQPEPPMMSPGRVGWHELHGGDPAATLDFYASLFGWSASRALDMGPMGTYQLFAYAGADRGGVMQAPPGVPPSWLYYFVVDGIDAALERVTAGGGTVLHGPQEVPGGAWIIMCRDPQGAHFALVSAKR